MLNRRDLFAASAVVAVAAVPVAASGAASFPISGEAATAYAQQEAAAINQIVERLNAGRYPEEEWSAWEQRDNQFMMWAESLPISPDYARAKAIAFRSIYDRNGGLDAFLDHNRTTDSRLALQVVKCMIGGLN